MNLRRIQEPFKSASAAPKRPRYTNLPNCILRGKIRRGREILRSCRLCPRQCGIDRLNGGIGFCYQGGAPGVAKALPHHGEEPPLSGSAGAGTVFFSGCTMSCLFCQNWQISQARAGGEHYSGELAAAFLRMQELGCHNVELVSPTPHIPFILEAVEAAAQKGLRIPLVYNTNGFMSMEALDLLDGIIDIYLPDMKYADDTLAMEYSCAPEYVAHNRRAVEEMFRQTGHLEMGEGGAAVKGLIVRILLLPVQAEGAEHTLEFIAAQLAPDTAVSIMSQYTPLHHAITHPRLGSPVAPERARRVAQKALSLGFSNLWLQDERAKGIFVPDFEQDNPFGEENVAAC